MPAPTARSRPAAPGPRWRPGLAALGEPFSVPVAPTPLPDPVLLHAHPGLRARIAAAGLTPTDAELAALTAGAALPPGACSRATVYSGHQFGVWAGQLGDGRAILIGELDTGNGPLELQIKGAGRTPYSRFGDGRAVLRSTIREYLASVALEGLGIPTTGALSIVASSEPVQRETVERAAALIRTAPSHLRFGHFQHFAAAGDLDALRRLAHWTIRHHFPQHDGRTPDIAAWAAEVVERSARLVAAWQAVGFCHGVLNTDNMSVLGLTLDYGPYGFVEAFDPGWICNHSDSTGRYAWGRQPAVVHWNCARLLEALLPLLDDRPDRAEALATALLDRFAPAYNDAILAGWRRRLALPGVQDADAALLERWLGLLATHRLDLTRTMRLLAEHAGEPVPPPELRALAGIAHWWRDWNARCAALAPGERRRQMAVANPIRVLRNHLAQHVIAAVQAGDTWVLAEAFEAFADPFRPHPNDALWAAPPPPGTPPVCVSCSS